MGRKMLPSGATTLNDLVCCDGSNRKDPRPNLLDQLIEDDLDPADLKTIPPTLREIVDNSMSVFLRIKDSAEWNLCAKRNEFSVFNCPFPGHEFMYWKVEFPSIKGTRDRITAEMFDYRLRTQWDKENLMKGRVLRRYADEYMIVQWFTYPAGGGVITSREFLEARSVVRKENGSIYLTCPSIEYDVLRSLGITADSNSGSTRAHKFPGNGFALEPVSPLKEGEDPNGYRQFKMTLISCIDLGGCLPKGIINLVTTQSLVDSSFKEYARMNVVFTQ